MKKRGARALMRLDKKYLPTSKRSAMQLSFGMIFSIILIIAFAAFAFYAIKIFLGIQQTAKVAAFRENLQEDVNNLWRLTQGSQKVSYDISSKVEQVCFRRWNYENLIFMPEDAVELEPISIENIDIDEITKRDNPFCINKKNGKIEMILSKAYGKNLVTISGS